MNSPMQPGSMHQVRRQFIQANQDFDAYSAVFDCAAQRLHSRLALLAITPEKILDLGCRSGYQLGDLQRHYPLAYLVGADPAPALPLRESKNWLRWLRRRRSPDNDRVACDPHDLPFADGSFDLVVSNLLLPWCRAPHRVFAEVARVLSPHGAFLFTSAGPDTLMEYRKAWAAVDNHIHGFGLIDMHDLGDTMLASGFAAPVLDRENLIVDYPSIEALQHELLCLGAGNVAVGRRPGLMAPSVVRRLQQSVAGMSRFTVTLELVQGHGWKTALPTASTQLPGEYRVSADSLRGSWSNPMLQRKS